MALGALLSFAAAQDEDRSHNAVYTRAADSVVAVRALATLGERSGTGIILEADGLILTSAAVVPEDATEVRVYLRGPAMRPARIIACSPRDEITLLRIEPPRKLLPAKLGASAGLKIGQMTYTLGNAENSFINDDAPAFNMGILSGVYTLPEAKQTSVYRGMVLETTAAVNSHMEGAPLLDSGAAVIGMVTLNYSPNRWLGNAIPIDVLKPRIREMMAARRAEAPDETPPGEGDLGFTVKLAGRGVVVDRVDPKGPAAACGLAPGDVIETIGKKRIASLEDFAAATRPIKAGSVVVITLGSHDKVTMEAAARAK